MKLPHIYPVSPLYRSRASRGVPSLGTIAHAAGAPAAAANAPAAAGAAAAGAAGAEGAGAGSTRAPCATWLGLGLGLS